MNFRSLFAGLVIAVATRVAVALAPLARLESVQKVRLPSAWYGSGRSPRSTRIAARHYIGAVRLMPIRDAPDPILDR